MIDDDVTDALAELVAETGAVGAKIVLYFDGATPAVADSARLVPLGDGEALRIDFAPDAAPKSDVAAMLERAVRTLRVIRRRWEATRLPAIAYTRGGGAGPAVGRVVDRIVAYLKALADIDRASNAFVTRGTVLVASARDASPAETARWTFLARRVLATHAPGSSHGEIVDPDAYAMTFWYDAALVVLVDEPYAVDFVRHRCRQVARELCNLLPLLDPEPPSNAAERQD